MDFVNQFFVDLASFIASVILVPVSVVYDSFMAPLQPSIVSLQTMISSFGLLIDTFVSFFSWMPSFLSFPIVLMMGIILVIVIIAFVTKIIGTIALSGWFK